MDIDATFSNNLSPDVIEFLISEGVRVPSRPPTENNHQGKQRFLLVINAAVEEEKKIRIIKAAVKTASRNRHPKIFTGMIAGNPSTQIDGLGGSFQYEESNSMVSESM